MEDENSAPFEKVEQYRKSAIARLSTLSEALPLDTPYRLNIDPASSCNFKCPFCPTGDHELLKSVGRKQGLMDFGLYKKVIDDLKQFSRPLRVLLLHKDGEPLLNPHIVEMVQYARSAGIADSIKMTTNGSLLNRAKARALIAAGLDSIKVSVEHVSDDGYRSITGGFDKYDRIVQSVRDLHEACAEINPGATVHVKIADTGLTDEERRKFLRDFASISHSINIDTLMGWSNSQMKDFTLGVDVKLSMHSCSELARDRIVCPEAFKGLAVNFDGSISVCCVDWTFETAVGNVREQSIVDIWNGAPLREFRLLHLRGERDKVSPCANCQYMLGIPAQSDLDADRERLEMIYRGENSRPHEDAVG